MGCGASKPADAASTLAPVIQSLPSSKKLSEIVTYRAPQSPAEPPPAASDPVTVFNGDPVRKDFDYLAIEGGGVNGVSIAGAIGALEEEGILGGLKGFAGTSSGSQVATLLAAGYTARELSDALVSINFYDLLDDSAVQLQVGGSPALSARVPSNPVADINRFTTSFGWFKGEALQAMMDKFIAVKSGHPNTTFAQLEALTGKKLRIPATSVTAGRLKWFDAVRSPDMAVAVAVRASSAVPLFYAAVEWEGHMYVDGGCLRLLPFEAFNRARVLSHDPSEGPHSQEHTQDYAPGRTLGLSIRPSAANREGTDAGDDKPVPIKSIVDFALRLFEASVYGPDSANSNIADPASEDNVEVLKIALPPALAGPDAAANFGMTVAEKAALMEAGFQSTWQYFHRDGSASTAGGAPEWLRELLARGEAEAGAGRAEGEGPAPSRTNSAKEFVSKTVGAAAKSAQPGGAIDIVVVRQADGTLDSSPFHVRFGTYQGRLQEEEKRISIHVNDREAELTMQLSPSGEAYFTQEDGRAARPVQLSAAVQEAEAGAGGAVPSPDGSSGPQTEGKKRFAVPRAELLAKLGLVKGRNAMRFSFETKLWGRQELQCRCYLWDWNAKVVISDVDGTITKSDVKGHIYPLLGLDWTHKGVASFYSSIKANGYEMLYLSSRAIAQSATTRKFLSGVSQDGELLPDGPVLLNPESIFSAVYSEVIIKTPHLFKIAALLSTKALFPSEGNPFYAGFGNRTTDEKSYSEVEIPSDKIFTINPKSEIVCSGKTYTIATLAELCDQMFPPVSN